MALMVSASQGTQRELPPTGSHSSVCSHVVPLGVQDWVYNGTPKRGPRCVIVWELGMNREDGTPHVVTKNYALSLAANSNLKTDIESWLGRTLKVNETIDVEGFIGMGCVLNLVSYAKRDNTSGVKVGSVTPLGQGMVAIKARNTEYPKWIDEERAKAGLNVAPVAQGAPQGRGNTLGAVLDDDLPSGAVRA